MHSSGVQIRRPTQTDDAGRRGPRIKVLVVGPLDDSGGMARVTRLSAEGADTNRFHLRTCNTAKDTRPGRSLPAACWSHARRWARLMWAIMVHWPEVTHLHTCSFNTFRRTVLDAVTCRMLGRRYVLHIHGGEFAEFLASLTGLRRRLVFGVLRRAARVVLLGDVWRTKLEQLVPGLSLTVIPNAVEPPDEPDVLGQRGGGVLFVGDLSELKRPEDLLVAYSALPRSLRAQYALTFVGDGQPGREPWLAEVSRQLGVSSSVQFAGRRALDEVRQMMRRADLLVLPSRAEGMPLAVLEAMHAALPAIVSRVGAVPEMVADGVEALLVEPRDALGLTIAIKELLSDESRRSAIGRAARQRVQQGFSVERFRADLALLWSEVAAINRLAPVSPVPNLANNGPGALSARHLQRLATAVRFW